MMKTQIRRLNAVGISEMSEFHRRIYRENSTEDPPNHLLYDDEFSSSFEIPDTTQFFVDDEMTFSTQMEVGKYFCEIFNSSLVLNHVLYDQGIGSWLALQYFDSICDRRKNGTWIVKEEARYLPSDHYRRFYLHHIFSPTVIYATHQKNSKLLLNGPSHQVSEFTNKLSLHPEVMLNPEMMKVLFLLYWNTESDSPKIGATTNPREPGERISDGSLRRFVGPSSFVFQHSPTWDFWEMDAETILGMLPAEFDKWKQETPAKKPKSLLGRLGLRSE